MTCTAKDGPAAKCPHRTAPTVAEAAKVLLDQPYSVMARAFYAMDRMQGEGADRIMTAALRALAGEVQP